MKHNKKRIIKLAPCVILKKISAIFPKKNSECKDFDIK